MPRIPNTHGGGVATNANGLLFEQTTSLNDALINSGYEVASDGSVYNSERAHIGYSKSKYEFIHFLENSHVNLKVNSDTLLPDDTFINERNRTVYIIEKKFQSRSGSVDEKLQTCVYKTRQYEKLVSQFGYRVVYTYILNDWFHQPKYIDVLKFIKDEGCYYFFNELPLQFLGI